MDNFPTIIDIKEDNYKNMALRLYGNRLYSEQTIFEFLIEFLLVFTSQKYEKTMGNETVYDGKMEFHKSTRDMKYYTFPNMSLKNFIFFDRSKRETKIEIDEEVHKSIKETMIQALSEDKGSKDAIDMIEDIQDLFYGFSAVLKNRSWTAQSLLPICPELIFCEAMPKTSARQKISQLDDQQQKNIEIETNFEFTRHNFMARSGEVYYLHILQALNGNDENNVKREELENRLKHMLTSNSRVFSDLANWITDTWLKKQGLNSQANRNQMMQPMVMGSIPYGAYNVAGGHAVDELIMYLRNEMHPISKLELLSVGLVFQVLRMLNHRTGEVLSQEQLPIVIDLKGIKNSKTIRKISEQSYQSIEEGFEKAIMKQIDLYSSQYNKELTSEQKVEALATSKKHTTKMFKKLGKELGFIIPLRGAAERFTLSEDLIKFLVLSIVPPRGKMSFDTFLCELYDHFNIVVAPEQFKKVSNLFAFNSDFTSTFIENEQQLQILLKKSGFLEELSDATSIVANPYNEVKI